MVGTIRAFEPQHLAEAALLHRRVFGRNEFDAQDLSQRERYLGDVFLKRTDDASGVTSLVYEEGQKIVGFLGVVPREMTFMGKPVLAAVSSQFIVESTHRSTKVGIQLLRDYLKGPQDLSIADEANSSARILWEGFGGTTAFLYSFYWTRPLRLAQYTFSLLAGRSGSAGFAQAIRPVSRLLDAMAVHIPWNPLPPPATEAFGELASEDHLWSGLPEVSVDQTLRPAYGLAAWRWMLQRAQEKRDCGSFRRIVVRGHTQDMVGWYLYYLHPGGISEVLQMAAKRKCEPVVWSHLLQHAWQGGAAAISGRLQPGWLPVLSENRGQRCMFHRGPWVLVHSKNRDIARTFCEGTAFLSRLEGEWCLRYH